MSDRETIIKNCENWVNTHEGENYLLTYSSVVELLAVLKEQEIAYQGVKELLRQKMILFEDAIQRLKKQEAIEPIKQIEQTEWTVCGNCRNHIISKWIFCPYCGRSIKWE